MEGMASVWSYQQSVEDLKHMLLLTTLELESTQIAAKEERGRKEEQVKCLVHLLKLAFQEKDEAKDQLQLLLNKVAKLNSVKLTHEIPSLLPECPTFIPTKGNSGVMVMDSDNLSDSYNHHSYFSSPMNSLFDTATSPDISNMNIDCSRNLVMPNQPLIQEHNASSPNGISSKMTGTDPTSATIDHLTAKKPLPIKGNLLQAVMEAGPLLQTLLLAGQLPQWRNPPPLQSFQIPPVFIEGHDSVEFEQKSTINSTYDGDFQACSTSILNSHRRISSCVKKRQADNPNHMVKRKKFQR